MRPPRILMWMIRWQSPNLPPRSYIAGGLIRTAAKGAVSSNGFTAGPFFALFLQQIMELEFRTIYDPRYLTKIKINVIIIIEKIRSDAIISSIVSRNMA